jgi:hypothetical protein
MVEKAFQNMVLFAGPSRLLPGDVELHGLKEVTDRIFGKKLEDVKADWQKVFSQIREMLEETGTETPKGFSLDNVTVSLGFSAHGQLVFIAEAGVEASISLTFKRS